MDIIETIHFTSKGWIIGVPLLLMVLDIITGYANAWIKKQLSSTKMRKGLGHKLGELVQIIVGVIISLAFGRQEIELIISVYIIVMELTSIAENCEKLGVKMHPKLKERLNNVDDMMNK